MTPPFQPEDLLAETRWLSRLARALAGGTDTADDLVQDTMAAALAQPPQGLRDLRGWLAAVLRRRAGRVRAREQRRTEVERQAARPEAVAAADDEVARASLHRDVVDAVLGLDEPYRTALLLRFLRELPLADVAARTGAPLATVRSRLQRGLAQLRQRLDRRHGSRVAWLAILGAHSAVTAAAALVMSTKSILTSLAAAVVAAAALWLAVEAPPDAPLAPATGVAATEVAAATLLEAPAPSQRSPVSAEPEPPAAPGEPAAIVTGVAVDEETRAPLQGVDVRWHLVDGNAELPPDRATSDAAGRFTLTCPFRDPWPALQVLLRAPERALVSQELNKPEGTAPQRYDVGTVLVPPGTGVAGRVVDQKGVGVAAELLLFEVRYHTAAGQTVMPFQAIAVGRSADDGTFTLDARLVPKQNPLLVACSPAGLAWVDLPELTRSRSELRDLVMPLRSSVRLQVTARDAAGKPLAGVEVVAEPRFLPLGWDSPFPTGMERAPALRPLFAGTTDKDGRVAMQALPVHGTGLYTLVGRKAGFLDSLARLSLAPGERTHDLVLAPPRSIPVSGTVADLGGRPIAGATVELEGGDEQRAETDGNGRFTATVRTRAHPLRLTASATGFRPATEVRPVAADEQAVEVNFRLAVGAAFAGRVVDQHGFPVVAATAFVVGLEEPVSTDEQGRFRFESLPAGRSLALHVWPPEPREGFGEGVELSVTTADSPVTVRLQRRARGTCVLRTELLDAQGAPLEPARIQLTHADDKLWHPATGNIGMVTASDLGPGKWSLRIEPVRGHALYTSFQIAAGQKEHRVTLRQQVPATVVGEIALPPGSAVPAELHLEFGGDAVARFVAAEGQTALHDGRGLLVQTARGLAFRVDDVVPDLDLVVAVHTDGFAGEASARAAAGASARMTLLVQAEGAIRFVADAPWPQNRLRLFLRRPGQTFGEPFEVEGVERTTELRWRVAPGAWEWRIEMLPRGDAVPPRFEGKVEVAPGGEVQASVPVGAVR